MARLLADWTAPLGVTGLRADPSGVLDTSTVFQATLFPGMSTVTSRLRYISLIAAARYYRMRAGEAAETKLPLLEHIRRLEALIAVCSVLHHQNEGVVPTGIIGRDTAMEMSRQSEIVLRTNLKRPPYNIYRGTLAALDILDTSRSSDPLYDGAQPLAKAWDPSPAGPLGEHICNGILPERLSRQLVEAAAPAFCLCTVPNGSLEQAELIRRLFILDRASGEPLGRDEEARSTSWRFVLDLVCHSPGEQLVSERLMIRLLRPDLLSLSFSPVLRRCLFLWRWVAARTFFERGWTQLFRRTLQILRGASNGLTREDLRSEMKRSYLASSPAEQLSALVDEAYASCDSPMWLSARFSSSQPRDFLLSLLAGFICAKRDLENADVKDLEVLWSGGNISLGAQLERLECGINDSEAAHVFWGALAEESLIQHIRSSLRKMSAGNPDSLLVDFDAGRWSVPNKAVKAIDFGLGIAEGSSRLDIALGWAEQLNLIKAQEHAYMLTPGGEECRQRWDKEYGS